MHRIFDEITAELQQFVSVTGSMEPQDLSRLTTILREIDFTRDTLAEDMYRQMRLETNVAWLASKYEHLVELSEVSLKRHKAKLLISAPAKSDDGKPEKAEAAWKAEARAECDEEYNNLYKEHLLNKRIHSFLERIGRSLRTRSQITEALFRKESMYTGQS
jgi:hypothetical protein